MAMDPPDSEAQQIQAQAQPQPDLETKKRLELPQINLRQFTKWPDSAPRPELLLATIRGLAKERKIGFLDHADVRLRQRGFDIFDVFAALDKSGRIDGSIEAGKNEGEWKVKIVDVPEGTSRKMGVITIVVKERRLLIKTVEWEDR